METFSIQTTQNVVIKHSLAGLLERIGAQVIDSFFIISYVIVLLSFFKEIILENTVLLYCVLLPIICYHFVFEFFFQGQTPGKMILRVKVIKIDGSQPGILSYFLRWIFRFVDVSLFSGVVAMVTILINGKGQRLGDIAADTTVIKLNSKVTLENTIYRETPINYRVKYASVVNLTDEDVNVVKDVLLNYQKKKNIGALMMANETKAAVESKINLVGDKKVSPDIFLKAILLDYNFLHRNRWSD